MTTNGTAAPDRSAAAESARPNSAAAPPRIFSGPRAWLAPFQSFLTKMGGGDLRVGTGLAAALAVTALVLLRSADNDFVLDDYYGVAANRYIGNWDYVWKSLVRDQWWVLDPRHLPQSQDYRPLQNLWFALNFYLFGRNPIGWHLAAIPFHLLAAYLAFRVASLLTQDRWTALLAAVLFALTPIHAQAAIWLSALAYPMSAVFEFGAFELYLRGGAPRHWLALSMVLFAGAMLSCDSTIVFPALVAAHAVLLGPDRSYRSYRTYSSYGQLMAGAHRAFAAIWPYLLEVAGYLALRYWVLGFISRPNALNPRHLTIADLVLTIPGIIATDLALLAMPWRASPSHHSLIANHASFAAPGFYQPVLGLAALCGAGFLLLRRHPHRRLYLFCAAWFLIGIGPVLNLNGLFAPAAIQDRYLYLPSFAFCLMAADLAISFARGSDLRMTAVWTASAVIAAAYAAQLYSVQRYWHDDVAVRTRDEQESPEEPSSHLNLAAALEARGDPAAARHQLAIAINLDPNYARDAYHDLAHIDEGLGDHRAAEHAMVEWIARFGHPNPGAYAELALIADAAGDADGTEAALARAAALPLGANVAALARAQLFYRHGDRNGAETALRQLLTRAPNDVAALDILGAVMLSEHRYEDALAAYRRAASIVPRDATLHYRIALTLHQMGRERAARTECAIALAAAPNDRAARALMADLERGGGK